MTSPATRSRSSSPAAHRTASSRPSSSPLDAGGARIHEGDHVITFYDFDAPPEAQFQFADFEGRNPMFVLARLFAAAVIALGGWRGFLALVGVAVSLVVLVTVVLPALLEGEPPVWVALAGTSAVALIALYLAHGLWNGPRSPCSARSPASC